jgi:hypothetical protein
LKNFWSNKNGVVVSINRPKEPFTPKGVQRFLRHQRRSELAFAPNKIEKQALSRSFPTSDTFGRHKSRLHHLPCGYLRPSEYRRRHREGRASSLLLKQKTDLTMVGSVRKQIMNNYAIGRWL